MDDLTPAAGKGKVSKAFHCVIKTADYETVEVVNTLEAGRKAGRAQVALAARESWQLHQRSRELQPIPPPSGPWS